MLPQIRAAARRASPRLSRGPPIEARLPFIGGLESGIFRALRARLAQR